MAGSRLATPSAWLMPRQPAWLALMLVALVVSLCLSQRIGLSTACAYSPHAEHNTTIVPASATSNSDSINNADNEGCSLSEQLLSKVWSQIEPILIAILLPLFLWLFRPQFSGYCRRSSLPPLFAGRRRHLVLCIFRE